MARYALVIGIQNYQSPYLQPLSKAAADAEAIAQPLEQHGDFQQVMRLPARWVEAEQRESVSRKKSLRGAELGQALQTFLLEQAVKQDALIYFSGHGFVTTDSLGDREGYLAPSDVQLEVEGDRIAAQKYSISLNSLNRLIEKSDLSSLVVLLDCCHSGYFIDRPLTEQSLSAFRHKQDYCLITASRGFEQAFEGEQYSVFTAAVLAGLSRENANPKTGRVSGDRLFDSVYTQLQNRGGTGCILLWAA